MILLATLLASCGGRPGLTVSIAGATVPTVLASTTEGTACSASHGDAFPQDLPLTTLHAASSVLLQFEAGQAATQIRGWIYEGEGPSLSGPIEEFALAGRSGTYQPRSMFISRTYSVTVNVMWSYLVTQGEETHLFRLRVEP